MQVQSGLLDLDQAMQAATLAGAVLKTTFGKGSANVTGVQVEGRIVADVEVIPSSRGSTNFMDVKISGRSLRDALVAADKDVITYDEAVGRADSTGTRLQPKFERGTVNLASLEVVSRSGTPIPVALMPGSTNIAEARVSGTSLRQALKLVS